MSASASAVPPTSAGRNGPAHSRTVSSGFVNGQSVEALANDSSIAHLQRTFGNRRMGVVANRGSTVASASPSDFQAARQQIVQRSFHSTPGNTPAQNQGDPFFRPPEAIVAQHGAPNRIQRVHSAQQRRRTEAQKREPNISARLTVLQQRLKPLQEDVEIWRSTQFLPQLILGRIEKAEEKLQDVADHNDDKMHHSGRHNKLVAAERWIGQAEAIWTEVKASLGSLQSSLNKGAVLFEINDVEKMAQGNADAQIVRLKPHLKYFVDFAAHFDLALEVYQATDPRDPDAARVQMAKYAPFGYNKALYDSTLADATTTAEQTVGEEIGKLKLAEETLENNTPNEASLGPGVMSGKVKREALRALKSQHTSELKNASEARQAAETSKDSRVAGLQQSLFERAKSYIESNGKGSNAEINAIANFAVRESKGVLAKVDEILGGYKAAGPNVTAALFQEVYAIARNGNHAGWAISTAGGNRDIALKLAGWLKAGKGTQTQLSDLYKWTNDIVATIESRLAGLDVPPIHGLYKALYEAVLQHAPTQPQERAQLDAVFDALRGGGAGIDAAEVHSLVTECKKTAGALQKLAAVALLGADTDRLGVSMKSRGWKSADIARVIANATTNAEGPSNAQLHALIKLSYDYVLFPPNLAVCVQSKGVNSWDTFLILARRFLEAGNPGSLGAVAASEYEGARLEIKTIRPAGRTKDLMVRARQSRMNHFVEGHTYKDFKFTEGNIARRTHPVTGAQLPSSLWKNQNHTLNNVRDELANTMDDPTVQNMANTVAQYDHERNEVAYLASRTVRLTNMDRQAQKSSFANQDNTDGVFVTQFYPTGGDADAVDTAHLRAMARLYGIVKKVDD